MDNMHTCTKCMHTSTHMWDMSAASEANTHGETWFHHTLLHYCQLGLCVITIISCIVNNNDNSLISLYKLLPLFYLCVFVSLVLGA